tara:strand:+ start:346 stop:1116 length:771 start_codon:yes stop_codon:yes gene_type:complete
MKLGLVIPAYNEGKRIARTLEAYSEYFDSLLSKEFDYEIHIVLNNCSDNTEDLVSAFRKKNKRITYKDYRIQGKGFAVMKGFKYFEDKPVDVIGFVDADLATPPAPYHDLVKNINGYDGAIANRNDPRSKINNSNHRGITSSGFNYVVRLLMHLPHKDTQCGAKLFTKRAIKEILKKEIGAEWAFDVDLLYHMKSLGYKINDVPTLWFEQAGGTIALITPFKMFASIVRLRLVNSPLSFIVKAYDKLPESIKIHSW